MENYTKPTFNSDSFNCPHCDAYSHQIWRDVYHELNWKSTVKNLKIAFCSKCGIFSLWLNNKMIYPDSSGIPIPNTDLSQEIKDDYNEAREIINRSPRGACALLRLALQKLCKDLGESGKNINDDIKKLVANGLPSKIQQSLDIVRVIGNNAVHPGEINLKDNVEVATKLFSLINIIAEIMITQPKKIEETYNGLPGDQLENIKKRDS